MPVTEFSEYGEGLKGKCPLYWFKVPSRPVFSFAGVWRSCPGHSSVFAFLTCERFRYKPDGNVYHCPGDKLLDLQTDT